ncbi:MAG: glycosyltransferase family 4 protein [Elusimicrobia bacterium]|nr:glycosyltransferase family 4 protein [Elusimicrobiota bacterium]
MNIGFNIRLLDAEVAITGQVVHAANLLDQILNMNQHHNITLYGYDVPLHKEFATHLQGPRVKLRTITKTGSRALDYLRLQGLIAIDLARGKLDLLHVFTPSDLGPLPSRKILATVHDTYSFLSAKDREGKNSRWSTRWRVGLARRADVVVTVSEFSKSEIQKHLGIPPQRIHVIHNGISPLFKALDATIRKAYRERFNFQGEVILHIGNFTPNKNYARLIRAFKEVSKNLKEASLVMVGDTSIGNHREVLRVVAETGLSHRVTFLSRLSTPDLVGLYNAADIFVFPSLYEGFGLPVLEAMACGLPVITSKTSSLPEIVGDAALLVDPTDVQGLAHSMSQLLTSRALQKTYTDRGIERSKEFSWKRVAERVLNLYDLYSAENGPLTKEAQKTPCELQSSTI